MHKSVLLVDDHPVFRKGLRSLLEDEEDMYVAGEAGDGQEALTLIEELSPDIVIMDVTMPGLGGIETTKRITADFPDTIVVALSIHPEQQFVRDMLQAGAAGYILKASVPEELIKGIRAVMIGEGYLSPAITGLVVSEFRKSASYEQGLQREQKEIIETKLHAPAMPDAYLHRPRLTKILDRKRKLPLQIISAPAGYGKSTLISCWLMNHEWPYSWLSLDENDNDLRQFLRYFLHAVDTLFPTAVSKSIALLEAPRLAPIKVLASTLVNEVNLIEEDFILVLDDFHTILEKQVHDLLSELLHHPPHSFHLILISRTDPFLEKARLRAHGLLAEIRQQELEFTESEIADFFRGLLNQDIDKVISAKWKQKTEGWITGLRLATLSINNLNELESRLLELKGSSHYIAEYLFNEILTKQPENIRNHLMFLSIVDQFSASLCEALCPYPKNECELDGWQLIRWMNTNHLFLIPLDTQGRWFRFHHLFQLLLKNQLERYHSPDDIAALHLRASEWFEKQGLIMEALKHSLAAGNVDGAADIFVRHRRAEQDADRWRVVERWLEMFPKETRQQHPELLLAQAWIVHDRYELRNIAPIVELLDPLLHDDEATDRVLSGELDFFKGVLLFWQGKGEASLKHLMEARRLIPQEHPRMTGLVEIYLGLGRQMTGQKDKALHELIKQSQHEITFKGEHLSRLFLAQGLIYMVSGELAQAADAAHRVENVTKKLNILYMHGWSQYIQAVSHFRFHELEAAARFFVQVVENRYLTHTRIVIDSLAGLALVYQSMQRPGAAMETLNQLLEFSEETEDPGNRLVAHSAHARLALAQGDLNSASRWMRSFDEMPPVPFLFIWLENPSITQVRVWLAIGSVELLRKALELIQAQRKELAALHNTCKTIELMVLQSATLEKLRRNAEALAVLEEVVELAEPDGWIQPFLEPGSILKDLLVQLKEQKTSTEYIEKLLKVIHAAELVTKTAPRSETDLGAPSDLDPLTAREKEILGLLATGRANKEIGEKLFVSTETVKTHLKNIYQKLGVKSRFEAATKANALGLTGKGRDQDKEE